MGKNVSIYYTRRLIAHFLDATILPFICRLNAKLN